VIQYYVKTVKHVAELFSSTDSPIILVFSKLTPATTVRRPGISSN